MTHFTKNWIILSTSALTLIPRVRHPIVYSFGPIASTVSINPSGTTTFSRDKFIPRRRFNFILCKCLIIRAISDWLDLFRTSQRFCTNSLRTDSIAENCARGGTRTRKPFGIRPSNVRVCQFHHPSAERGNFPQTATTGKCRVYSSCSRFRSYL